MIVGRCSSELSKRKLPGQIKKVTSSERSAARIYRITDGLWRAVEGPRRCLLTDALQSFPATKTMKEIKKS